ncbi:hypothetical protein IW261DRAFT_1561507 [Armillaria novae-zelandiae]|uniref:Uncharacterized protein n=1 Tax=Armillaria novae-zelandiae TaxID=153914 RepID=A0AA39UI67_9AGAR|nr:hypothetical protein IW261DRAFT_1561507 [Armillaria novae-zelandiae]
MPCHRSCKKFAPRYPPTYDEALRVPSPLYLPIGEYTARYHPYSLSYRFEGEYTGVPVPQTPAIIPQTGRFIDPPYYDLDDYIGYEIEEIDEHEDDGDGWDDKDRDDQERRDDVLVAPLLCVLALFVWWVSYFV